jgi:hypothetical protein
MYNRNLLPPVRFARVGGFDKRPNPLGIANVYAKPKINVYKSVTNGYTGPISVILFLA